MTAQSRATLKGYLNSGDQPTESQFADLVDSFVIISEITGTTGTTGGASATAQILKDWTESEAYEVTSATLDSDSVVFSATVKWPDGSAGTFTRATKNSTWLAVDAYTISHTDSGQTVTQAAVTRDSNGNVTTKPELTVA